MNVQDVKLEKLIANPWQPRKTVDKDNLERLTESIRAVGILHPIMVREASDGFEIAFGHQRVSASEQLGLETIPAIVREIDDKAMRIFAIAENVNGLGLADSDKEEAIYRLWEDVYSKEPSSGRGGGQWINVTLMGKEIGLAQNTITQMLAAHEARKLSARDSSDLATRDMTNIASVAKVDEKAAKALLEARAKEKIGSRELTEVASQVRDAPNTQARLDIIDAVKDANKEALGIQKKAITDAKRKTKVKVELGPDQRALKRIISAKKKIVSAFRSAEATRLTPVFREKVIDISRDIIAHLKKFNEDLET